MTLTFSGIVQEFKPELIKPDPEAGPSDNKNILPPAAVAPNVPDPAANLQHLVEEAVKKVLLGGGLDPSKLLSGSGIDTSAVLAKIKEEKQESDDDVCIIEDDTPDTPGPSTESEPVSPPTKPKLYLPPDNCPQYKPTPIKELEKRAQASINPSIVRASSLTTTKSSVVPKPSSSKPKFSYVPSPTKKSVLGDIGDLTDSDEEKQDNPDVLGNYLMT